ncbi:FAD-binding oxidoreductase [Streptomyces sp. SID3343]|uniref:FAD-binding oxidoreductase n=1 Tax=Streptomyces sp. SID3343 TaxID=2690260 RepID=UPI00136D714E|nr:FAD-binding oxidoreductase [Streptomyces sp. SID3343]MYW01792.1 FAD-binding protein [Streptomyces sp. SID3343]
MSSSTRTVEPVVVTRDDPRYAALLDRGYNRRSRASPERISVVGSTEHVVEAVDRAVQAGQRIGVRSGGHCLETLVDDVEHLIDFTRMRSISHDPARNAIVIEPGATMGEIYQTLHHTWGVTLPGGDCNAVAAGGHIPGNGFGTMARRHGLIADHLYAVETVVVGADGVPRAVVATREEDDPNRDLWWAHVGGGGGTFGAATRFWMRSPGAVGTDPARLLPTPPRAQCAVQAVWDWADLDEDRLVRLAANFGAWCEENSAPGSPGTRLYGTLGMRRVEAGQVRVTAFIDPTEPGAEAVLADFLARVSAGLLVTPRVSRSASAAWLTAALAFPDSSVAQGVLGPPRWKSKIAILNRRYTDEQIATAFGHLTRPDYAGPSSGLSLTTYGGRINAPAPGATAFPHRAGTVLAGFFSVWDTPADDERHLEWNRRLYRDVHAATGGVPEPNGHTDGIAPNWPDLDLLDAAWNSSPLPVGALYHKENLLPLRRAKAAWDPHSVFRHPLSTQPHADPAAPL